MKYFRNMIIASAVFGLAFLGFGLDTAGSTAPITAPVTGATGMCTNYRETAKVSGSVTVAAPLSTETVNQWRLPITGSVSGLKANTFYDIHFSELYVSDNSIIGCATNHLVTTKTNSYGRLNIRANMYLYGPSIRVAHVAITKYDPYTSFSLRTGVASTPTLVTVG